MKITKQLLNQLVNQPETRIGKVFAFTVQSLIILSLITFSIDTLPNISESTQNILTLIEVITVIIFTLEYILRIYVAENKLKFIFSFYGLIDLLAILPFYISATMDLRTLRIFRLLRLFRVLKLVRYNQAISRLHRAFIISKEELMLFSFVALIVLYLSAVGIYYFEHDVQPDKFTSVFHSLWWAVATLTTVGYGDVFPVTVGGKIFTFLILMVGLGIVSVPAGLISSSMTQVREEDTRKETAASSNDEG